MEFSTFILYALFLGSGVLIGYNLRNSFAEELNRSLLDDLTYAKKKLAVLQSRPA